MESKNTGHYCVHKLHRKRMRDRYAGGGFDDLYDHQILEFLLFYSIPRGDTNVIAHELLNEFGTLSAVFDADYENLLGCKGVGDRSAALIKLIPCIAKAYIMDKETRYPRFDDIDKLGSYLVGYFLNSTKEQFVALLMTNKLEIIDIVPISTGIVNTCELSARRIAEYGFRKKASFIILAHNHPDGDVYPSEEDIRMTEELAVLFDKISMPLLEHFVVSGMSYGTVISHRTGEEKI